ncbi:MULTISPECIES: NAD(P)-dependent oxidoreductase [unclassified Halomonas]|uniref:NAD(P)-dependent oxidoreductase n=1 Tax=unclassified Halomonas TaxID=2609666 RepID=UPI0009904C50|nr:MULTISPECIES: NAD(P)-dependent oxidoreductase [unclassified Halomonas]AQU83882.1 2-hydroxy-3-oxopropionate reductase [Halomonas sp. 'Soap Lake \
MTTSRQVGIVGVGLMGHGIASSLLRAGHQVSFLEHPGNQPVEDLLAAGATALSSGREVARKNEVVILCVTGSPQVEAVLFEPNGVLEGLKPGCVVVDCSTALPSSTAKVAAKVTDAGGRFMDAAMTRTPKEAAEGRLNLIVGAPQELFEETLPLLQGFAENIAHAGDVGAGHTLKLLHNFVSLGFSAVLAEATAASRKAGISDTALLEVLSAGGGGGVVLERLRPYIADNDPSGFKFSVANASKDLGYYHTMTNQLAVEGGIAEAVRNLYHSVEDQSLSIPELIGVLERR